ncbi:uncharacterized protein BO97DRAFT_432326 [Aspergillus homomorphus CBS 101889]|uniref:Uncharacterized protein n=1 Tax=Aspergillus homomorphus (strain CBS 101889) TaxID=1450537 RepID=A0A395I4J4_ASPHC|nr:hypothetical protein BO97DRAFT_432326 [Aspergillus homomorphus CBS 101889]RAL15121.1 hypothetical protein BO97DRAFT_432326 [Aspergillus homomorphus CBS 101889]
MLAMMNRLTDQENWHAEVFDEAAVARWRAEGGPAAITTNPPLSDRARAWCVQELRDKAFAFRRTGHVRVLDAGSAVCKADGPLLAGLAEEVRGAVAPMLVEWMHRGQLDWRSPHILSLVDPALFPLVYGRSLVFADEERGGRVSVEGVRSGAYKYAGTTIAPVQVEKRTDADELQREIDFHLGLGYSTRSMRPQYHRNAPFYRWSPYYQALPCEVAFVDGDGDGDDDNVDAKVRITSPINNLHPAHRELYRAIETLVGRAIPLWNDCLVLGQHGWDDECVQDQPGPVPLRIITYGVEWKNELPELPPPSSELWLQAKRYLELPERDEHGSVTPHPSVSRVPRPSDS